MSGLVDFLSFALKSTIGEDSVFVVVAAAPCGSAFEPEVDFSDWSDFFLKFDLKSKICELGLALDESSSGFAGFYYQDLCNFNNNTSPRLIPTF